MDRAVAARPREARRRGQTSPAGGSLMFRAAEHANICGLLMLLSSGCPALPGCGAMDSDTLLYLPTSIDSAGGGGADGVIVADVDDDGDLDALSAWEGSDRVRLHRQGPAGSWTTITIGDGQDVAGVEDVAAGDIDGDGFLDVVAACESGRLTWIRQGAVWTPHVIDASYGQGCESWIDVEAADLDGDGGLEIVAACKGGGWVSVFHCPDGCVSGASFARRDIDTTTRRKASCIRLLDLDDDGDLDIVSAAREEVVGSIAWYENPGADEWLTADWAKHSIGHWADTIWLDTGDIDGDGRTDIAASSWENAAFAWFQQPTDLTAPWPLFTIGQLDGTKGAGITITDLDADGRTDVLVGTFRAFGPVAPPHARRAGRAAGSGPRGRPRSRRAP